MSGESRAAAVLRRRATSRARACPGDAGFSLVEVIVAIGLIGVVMASLSLFYVSSMATSNAQSGRQAAIQVALDGLERVRATDPTQLLAGRTNALTVTQWAAAPAAVAAHLAGMDRVWNDGAGTPKLPTTPQDTTVSGVLYRQSWYVGACWQPDTDEAPCDTTSSTNAVRMFRVLVAVTWAEQGCPDSACAYTASTLVSPATDDPIFDAHSTPNPTVTRPEDQTSEVGTPVTLAMQGSGGAPPLAWSASGLPTGLSINPSTGVISGTPTAAGPFPNVLVTLRDSLTRSDSASFSWTVGAAPPKPTKPSNQASDRTVAITALQLAKGTTGTGTLTWEAPTGLPPGLTMNLGTGQVTGTPTTAGTYTVTIKVRDSANRLGTETFEWVVNELPTLTAIVAQQSTVHRAIQALTPTVTGGTAAFTWTMSGQPNGLSINSGTGQITGTPTRTGTYTVTVRVTDKFSRSSTVTFTWRVS